MSLKTLVYCCFVSFASLTLHAQKYKITADPAWIKQRTIPAKSSVTKFDVKSGYYTTLADYQFNLNENAYYLREVLNVISYSGITKASQIQIPLDSSYQQLQIHHLYIWRNGEKIDRTNSLSFEIMNNEHSLQQGLYMGQVTLYSNLSDIRKNDLIDLSYTLVGKNPIFQEGKYLFVPLESGNPIDLLCARVIFAQEKHYYSSCVGCESSLALTTTKGENKEIEIIQKDIKAIELEENIPSWIVPFQYLILSSYQNWSEVNAWAQKVFYLESEPDLDVVFRELFKGGESREEKINKIIDFVQDDIRYMGIQSGIGSIKPLPPETVVKQRFGDCKDKSLLLVALLKKAGITDAYPALVNTRLKNALRTFHPSSELFDHCIVNFYVDSVSYWVDPTITLQGGDYRNMSLPDYGVGLIIGKSADSLSAIPKLNLKSGIKIKETLTFQSFYDPATLDISSTRYGAEADNRRFVLEYYGLKNISNGIAESLKAQYPAAVQVKDLAVQDNNLTNTLSNFYTYKVEGLWKKGTNKNDKSLTYYIFKFEPRTLYEYLNIFEIGNRTFDYALPHPLNLSFQAVFNLPNAILFEDKYTKYENDAFSLEEKIEQLNRHSFQITYNLSTKTDFIKAYQCQEISAEKQKIVAALPVLIYYPQ